MLNEDVSSFHNPIKARHWYPNLMLFMCLSFFPIINLIGLALAFKWSRDDKVSKRKQGFLKVMMGYLALATLLHLLIIFNLIPTFLGGPL